MIEFGALVPHPPIMVDEVGGEDALRVEATRRSMRTVAGRIGALAPETVILISPHAPIFADAVGILGRERLRGDLSRFRAGAEVEFDNDLELAHAIAEESFHGEVQAVVLTPDHSRRFRVSEFLDHGAVVPLTFLQESAGSARLVVMGFAAQPYDDLYEFGKAMARAVNRLGRRVVLLASGDLSHRLSQNAPAGYDPRGKEFDESLVRLIQAVDIQGVMDLDPVLIEKAGECGLRSLIMLMGAMDGRGIEAELLSYEGPFGVGYAVVAFAPGPEDPDRELSGRLRERRGQRIRDRRRNESPLARLARQVVESHVLGERPPDDPDDLPEIARGPAGVFVSIKKHGQLRGCIGTTDPTTESVVSEIRRNAVYASSQDPRFEPVQPSELDNLTYSVDVLGEAEVIEGLEQLDPMRYGVIVRRGNRSGLLLPALEGVEAAGEQVAIARKKAGIGPDEPVDLYRFEVVRFI